jgi:hypothetical protein
MTIKRIFWITFLYVSHGKVVPLRVIQGVEIEVKVQVIFEFMNFLDFSEVAGLEPRVEEQCRVSQIPKINWISRTSIFKCCLLLWVLTSKLLGQYSFALLFDPKAQALFRVATCTPVGLLLRERCLRFLLDLQLPPCIWKHLYFCTIEIF